MEPHLVTDPALSSVLSELLAREPIFHHPELGTTRADFERMTEETFWEVGASGRRYSRQYVLDELEKGQSGTNPHEDLLAHNFHCLELAPNLYLLTYTLVQGTRHTRRSTIWRRTSDDWKIVYHQGTVIADLNDESVLKRKS